MPGGSPLVCTVKRQVTALYQVKLLDKSEDSCSFNYPSYITVVVHISPVQQSLSGSQFQVGQSWMSVSVSWCGFMTLCQFVKCHQLPNWGCPHLLKACECWWCLYLSHCLCWVATIITAHVLCTGCWQPIPNNSFPRRAADRAWIRKEMLFSKILGRNPGSWQSMVGTGGDVVIQAFSLAGDWNAYPPGARPFSAHGCRCGCRCGCEYLAQYLTAETVVWTFILERPTLWSSFTKVSFTKLIKTLRYATSWIDSMAA